MKRYLLSTLTLSLLASFAFAAEPTAPISGIDTQFIQPSVRAQDDFFVYLNGKWLEKTEIPADKSSWGTFAKLRDDVQPQIRSIIESAQQEKNQKAGSEARKIGDLYASYMNEKKRDELGYKPLTGELAKIRGLKDKKAIPALIAHLSKIGVATPYTVYIAQDARESTRYAANIYQSGLGLPDRDYYLKKDDAKMADAKAKYEQHIAAMLAMVGRKDAAEAAKAIVALETDLAQAQWTKVENRDPVKQYNKVPLAKLGELTPGYDWKAAAAAAGVANKVDYVIVNQPSYLTGFNTVLEKTDLATWKSYFEWHLIHTYANYLSKPFVDTTFAFYGTALTGVTENRPVWKRAVSTVE
ncbi:MAG: M13 family peptidase, partial [Massilia sp.]